MQVDAHKDAVNLFERYAKGGDNADLQSIGGEDPSRASGASKDGGRVQKMGRARVLLTSIASLTSAMLAAIESHARFDKVKTPPGQCQPEVSSRILAEARAINDENIKKRFTAWTNLSHIRRIVTTAWPECVEAIQ